MGYVSTYFIIIKAYVNYVLGIPSTEVLENCEMLLVSIDQIVDRYHFLADAGIDPDEISAPLIKEMGNGLNYDQRDRLLQFIREIYPHR